MIDKQIGAALNRDLVNPDISVSEHVETELDNLIARRDKHRRQEEGDRPEEALWKENERQAQARRAQQNHIGWLAHEKHLRSVFLGRYLEKDRLINELESKPPK